MKKQVFALLLISFILSCTEFSSDFSNPASGTTTQGSYSSIITRGNYMYVADKSDLSTFDITIKADPKLIDRKTVGEGIESIFDYNGTLLIGSSSAMYIYEIQKGIPVRTASANYFQSAQISSCDPIVAANGKAYVTLSTAAIGPCQRIQNINELRTYDIQDITKPVLMNTQVMPEPKGLAVYNDYLFVCDNKDGLYVYGIKNKNEPTLLQKFGGFSAYDVIVKDGKVLVSSKRALIQYTFDGTLPSMKYVSTIQL
jgi:hypothetical protein